MCKKQLSSNKRKLIVKDKASDLRQKKKITFEKKTYFFPEILSNQKISLTYLETLDFESQLQCIDEKNKSHPVLNHESRMIQFIYNFLPVQGGLQLVHSLYEDFHVPGFGFVDLVLFP